MSEKLAIIGSGAIATGLAALAAHHGDVTMVARSDPSAKRARTSLERLCSRLAKPIDLDRVCIVTDPSELAHASFVVEAVIEDHEVKVALLCGLAALTGPDTILATTTSSLSVERLASECGQPDRFVGLHVFNPVLRMELVELVFPAAATPDTHRRALKLCATFDKTAVQVPDIPGFVVNRLLFPYLFSAVRLLEETDMEPVDIDTCMRLGGGHPMGPLALLDLVGLDVAQAIGETIGQAIPRRLLELIAAGEVGRKSGRGFYSY
jgi:3-hydroxybutyryl-CoA dehydrogenase